MKRRHEDTESGNEDSLDETVSEKPSRKSDSAKIELENHFIIRFPKVRVNLGLICCVIQ